MRWSSANNELDWGTLMPEVARRLLGEPQRIEAGGNTWRYGTYGSMAVNVGGERGGTWYDFEAAEGGGVLDLVATKLSSDRAGAVRWLKEQGLIASRSAGAPRIAPRVPPPKPKPQQKPVPTADLAAAILRVAVRADDTAARVYLAQRWTWPPPGIGPDLPPMVQWLPAAAVAGLPTWPGRGGRRDRMGLPAQTVGAVVFAFAVPGTPADAVSLVAVAADGRRLAWRQGKSLTFGPSRGRVFTARDDPGGSLWLVEGECDALALTLYGHGGVVRSVGGTSGYRVAGVAADPDNRPVVLVPDADHVGVAAVTSLLTGLPGRAVRLAPWPPPSDGDPARWLADRLVERVGIREDGGQDPASAVAGAWRDVLSDVARRNGLI